MAVSLLSCRMGYLMITVLLTVITSALHCSLQQVKPNLTSSLNAAERRNSGIFLNYTSFRQFQCQFSTVRKSEYFIASEVLLVAQSSTGEKNPTFDKIGPADDLR